MYLLYGKLYPAPITNGGFLRVIWPTYLSQNIATAAMYDKAFQLGWDACMKYWNP